MILAQQQITASVFDFNLRVSLAALAPLAIALTLLTIACRTLVRPGDALKGRHCEQTYVVENCLHALRVLRRDRHCLAGTILQHGLQFSRTAGRR